jgi:ABC-2 type transport system permease protein
MRSQQAVEIIEILPGLMAMSVLFGTTSMLAVTITFERKGHSFDRLLLAPISLKVMVLAKIIGSVLFGIFNAFVPIIFGAFLSDLSGVNWGFVFIGVLFIAFSSTLVGLVIAVSAKEIFEAQTYSNFFRFPMIFLCGLFFPVSTLPIFLRPLSYALPLTYGVDILHIALVKSGMMSVWLDILILSVFSVLLFYISMRNIQRKWIL